MHVLKDEDTAAMDTARDILLTLAYLHLDEEGRMTLATEAARALRYVEPYQSSPEMVGKGLITIFRTLEAKVEMSERHGPDDWPSVAAFRLRTDLDCERPIKSATATLTIKEVRDELCDIVS